MSVRGIPLVLGTAAAAVLAAGLIPLANGSAAHADADDVSPSADSDFIFHTIDVGLFTDTAAADPDDSGFTAEVFSSPWFTDIVTSGTDPSDSLASISGLSDIGAAGVGVSGETINTFESSVFPFLDSTIVIPFTNPFADFFTEFVPWGF